MHGPSFCCRPVSRKIITSSLLTLTGWVPVTCQMICQTISIAPSSGMAQKKSQRPVYASKNVLQPVVIFGIPSVTLSIDSEQSLSQVDSEPGLTKNSVLDVYFSMCFTR